MPPRSRLRITMSTRAVVAAGEPFMPRDDEYADADVALDEISSLRPTSEPAMLRVAAVGGNEKERKRVAGDWLCEADGSPPVRVPKPVWRYNRSSLQWACAQANWVSAWEECTDARWLIDAVNMEAMSRSLLAAAALACARAVMPLVQTDGPMYRRAIATATSWVDGKGTMRNLRAALTPASEASDRNVAAVSVAENYAADSIVYAMWSCIELRDKASHLGVWVHTANAVQTSWQANRNADALGADLAAAVRGAIPLLAVLRAAATSSPSR